MRVASRRRSRIANSLILSLVLVGSWFGMVTAQTHNLDQIRNGSRTAPLNPPDWVNGNANKTQAHLAEGYSQAYRLVITGLSLGANSITIEWDTKSGGKHGIDFITHYQRLLAHTPIFGHAAETIQPLLGLAGTFSAATTFPIPAPSGTNNGHNVATFFNSLPESERFMTIYNGTITSMSYPLQESLSETAAKTRLTINYNATDTTVVLAWGGHIARSTDWGVGFSAASINGASYHMRLADGNQQDKQLSSDAVVALNCSDQPACTTNDACGIAFCDPDTVQCTIGVSDAGTVCSAGGVCSNDAVCDGTHTYCPANTFRPATTVCRPSQGVCDVAEYCTGNSAECPANGYVGQGVVCGDVQAGACGGPGVCTGSSAMCPSNTIFPAGTLCRAQAGTCDLPDYCNGQSTACPDAIVTAGTVCAQASGVCANAAVCDGVTKTCQPETFKPSETVCRQAQGVCDIAETCTGSSAFCPGDSFAPSNTVCRSAAGVCDAAETCTGSAAACPADNFQPSSFVCRASAGVCDVADTCTGSSASCPADLKVAAGTECRTSAGICDVAEACNGTNPECPADNKVAAGTVCRASAGVCDLAEACNGTSPLCPIDAFKPNSVECRASAGICDVAEFCSGNSAACPNDRFLAAGNQCRAVEGACDVAETCSGSSAACPADGVKIGGTACRPEAGICDVAELCDGTSKGCPTDGFVLASANKLCRPSVAACDLPEYCNGSGVTCPADSYVAAGTQCRDGDNVCNPAEMCTGSSGFCPGDITFRPNPDTCTLSGAGVCRTAGFWGTHAGEEKKNSINITQAVINFHLKDLFPTGPLNVCGEKITTTKLYDAASALEALCVSVQGNQQLQLVRQLTAAALNCAVSGYYDCKEYDKYDLFSTCNTLCAENTAGDQAPYISYCIDGLDCVNNGGTFYHGGFVLPDGKIVPEGGYCKTGTCSGSGYTEMPCNGGDIQYCGPGDRCVADVDTCHDQSLCLHVDGQRYGPCFPETGPAGSASLCNDANKSACTVIGSGEGPAIYTSEKKNMCWYDSAPY